MSQIIYAIGDIHGRADLLTTLIELIEIDANGKSKQLVFLGDYCDRGPYTAQLLEAMLGLNLKEAIAPVFLLGNHDLWFKRALTAGSAAIFENWLQLRNGGTATLASYGVNPRDEWESLRDKLQRAVPDNHKKFLLNCRSRYQTDEFFFSHAGIDPAVSLEKQTDDVLIWGCSSFLGDQRSYGKMVIHGHYQSYYPVQRHNRICVDTSAAQTGNLTAVRLEKNQTVRFLQTCAY